ncbi:MAG: flavin reductase [Bacteroides sp.]|nr:flavin reductase [Bacteroides sp.]
MMKQIAIQELTDNFIESIGKEWMLVTAGNTGSFNTMTASWGGIGYIWNKPVVFVFIRPERYTYEFTEKSEYLTLSFLGEENKAIHKVCGSKSGRDTDKVAETGLKPIATEKGNVIFEQGRLQLECRILYKQFLEKDNFLQPELYQRWYNQGHGDNLHKMYVAEIVNVWSKG